MAFTNKLFYISVSVAVASLVSFLAHVFVIYFINRYKFQFYFLLPYWVFFLILVALLIAFVILVQNIMNLRITLDGQISKINELENCGDKYFRLDMDGVKA